MKYGEALTKLVNLDATLAAGQLRGLAKFVETETGRAYHRGVQDGHVNTVMSLDTAVDEDAGADEDTLDAAAIDENYDDPDEFGSYQPTA